MSLPPALLARLAQRGLVQKQKENNPPTTPPAVPNPADNEEVIAEDYDEMETEEKHGPEKYHHLMENKRPAEDNFWLERMKARMSESSSILGHKGCPNKYNMWHKCTLYCVNTWQGKEEPTREYLRRYQRLRKKYPLPKDWTEVYDPGCGCFYFVNEVDNVVSWLPPTHPLSEVTKSAAYYRRQLEDADGGDGVHDDDDGSDVEPDNDSDEDSNLDAKKRHQREVDDIISSALKSKSPTLSKDDFPELGIQLPRKPKARDLDRTLSRNQRRDRERERDRSERNRGSSDKYREDIRDRERERERDRHSNASKRRGGGDGDALDPMDPSAYSDIPRGKWSDGLEAGGAASARDKKSTHADEARERSRRKSDSDMDSADGEEDYN